MLVTEYYLTMNLKKGENFVTRKITKAVAAIISGKQDVLELGIFDSKRDWGHA